MATLTATSRDARMDFRLNQEHKRLIEQAARVTGQSISDFAVATLVRVAQQTVDEATVTRLSMRDRDTFLELIEADAQPNAALVAAADRYKKRRA